MLKLPLVLLASLFASFSSASATELMVSVTAYSSDQSQTDSTPFITATGTRTQIGTLAISRDLVGKYGYGKKIRIIRWLKTDGCNTKRMPYNIVFSAEDTMNIRYSRKIDIWMPSYRTALSFGSCRAIIKIS